LITSNFTADTIALFLNVKQSTILFNIFQHVYTRLIDFLDYWKLSFLNDINFRYSSILFLLNTRLCEQWMVSTFPNISETLEEHVRNNQMYMILKLNCE